MPTTILKEKLQQESENLFTGTIGRHFVTIERTRWNTWEGTAYPDGGEAAIYLRGDTMREVKDALTNRLKARL